LRTACQAKSQQGELPVEAAAQLDDTMDVVAEVVMVILNHIDILQPSFKATAVILKVRSLIAVTTSKLTLSLTP
jgi:hypothetical protein